jgi:hypothetical protein
MSFDVPTDTSLASDRERLCVRLRGIGGENLSVREYVAGRSFDGLPDLRSVATEDEKTKNGGPFKGFEQFGAKVAMLLHRSEVIFATKRPIVKKRHGCDNLSRLDEDS